MISNYKGKHLCSFDVKIEEAASFNGEYKTQQP